ncbi:hypothetical protein MMC29_001396 [Sticta canariensis]|nr:hypothetical protein [Sticta canariensis]
MFGQSRSHSGPGLSINTSSANSLSASSQPQPSAGLFGLTQPEKPAGGLFGSVTSGSQTQQSNSLFGSAASNQAGSLLGSQNTNNQQQQIGSVFGSQPIGSQGGGNIFNSQPSQQQGGGLFGGSSIQPRQAGGLFSSLGQNQTQGQNQDHSLQSNSMFGASNQIGASSLFQKPPPQNQTQNLQSQQPFIFSASIGQYSQQQQTVPGVRININELRPTTRFTDLHEDLQRMIGDVDNFILRQIGLCEECEGAIENVASFSSVPNDVEYCTKTLETVQDALENDAEAIAHAKTLVKTDVANAKLSFKVIQNLKMPPQYQQSGVWRSPDLSQAAARTLSDDDRLGPSSNLVSYFSQEVDNMSKTLEGYKRSIGEVETYLKGVEVNTVHQMQQMAFTQGQDGQPKSAEDQVRELAAVLREFENGILGVAGKVGGTREKLQEVMLGNVGSRNGRTRRF